MLLCQYFCSVMQTHKRDPSWLKRTPVFLILFVFVKKKRKILLCSGLFFWLTKNLDGDDDDGFE